MDQPNVAREKAAYRAKLKEQRDHIPASVRKRLDAALVKKIAASPEFLSASGVLLFAPIGSECNLLGLVRIAREKNIPVYFPVSDPSAYTLIFRELREGDKLAKGTYGIPEPPEASPILEPDERTLCVLPALAFDVFGNRIGYGKGFYDRFLASFPGVSFGAVYRGMIPSTALPVGLYDQPVSYVFTETERIDARLNRRRGAQASSNAKHSALSMRFQTLIRRIKNAKITAAVTGAFSSLFSALRPRKEDPDPTPESSVQALPALPSEIGSSSDSSSETSSDSRPVSFREGLRAFVSGQKPLHAPLLLTLSVFVLLLLSRLLDSVLIDRGNEALGVILLQIFIFVIPALLYCSIKGESFPKKLRMKPIRPEHLWFCLCLLIVMITGSLLLCILTGGISSLVGNYTLYDTFVARISGGNLSETFYVILAYGILPAFCEELVFRLILCASFESRGVPVAILAESLLFSMLHFSFPLFPSYFFLGILLGFSLYVTRSGLSVFLLHLLYNLFCLFGQPCLSSFYVRAGSTEIFLFLLVFLFLLFSAFLAGEARKIFHIYSISSLSSSYTVPISAKSVPAALLSSLFSPFFAVILVLWIVFAIL